MSTITSLTLGALALLGAGTLWGFALQNGLFPMIDASKARNILPDATNTPFIASFTGIGPIDDYLATLLVFFWPVATGEGGPGPNLMATVFGSQACAALTILMIEGFRKGNVGKAVSFISIFSFFIQTVGMAITVPVYLLIHVFTSPTFSSPTPSNLLVSNIDAIPFGLLFGLLAPTVYMVLPSPSILSKGQKIWSIVIWQASPIYAICVSKLLGAASPHKTKMTSIPRQLMHLRAAYKYALVVSVPVYIAAWTLSLSCLYAPSLFTSQAAIALHPLNAFIPKSPLSGAKANNVAQGSHWFLQWDFWITSAAFLVFAITAKYKVTGMNPLYDIVPIALRVALLGPMSAALSYMWERDELVLSKVEGSTPLPSLSPKVEGRRVT